MRVGIIAANNIRYSPYIFFYTLRNRQILFIGCLCSVFTELVQLGLEMGYCETDDVLYNTFGTAIGVWVWFWQSKRLNLQRSGNPGKGET